MLFLFIALGLILLFFIFVGVYSFLIYNAAFSRFDNFVSIEEADIASTHYAPYEKDLRESYARLKELKYEKVYIKSKEGYKLCGYYYNNNDSDKLCFMVHGYQSHPFNNFCINGIDFYDKGYSLFFMIHRSHFESEGEKITFGIKEQDDLMLWYDYIVKEIKPKKMVVYGTSMGCNVVARVIDKFDDPVKACVLDCGYVNLPDELNFILKKKNVFLPKLTGKFISLYAKLFLKLDVKEGDTRDALSKTKIPTFFIHGKQDILVDYNDSFRNYDACASRKEIYFNEVADHATGYFAGREEVREKIFNFIGE